MLWSWQHLDRWVAMQHIYTTALTGHIQYSWRVDILKASFVRVQCGSSQLSISLSQVTVSREKTLLLHNAAPGPSRPFPVTRPRALAKSWLWCYDMGEMCHCTSHPSVWIGGCLLESANSSGMTQDLRLCWLVVITSLFPLREKSSSLSSPAVHVPPFINTMFGEERILYRLVFVHVHTGLLGDLLLSMASSMPPLYLNSICTWICIQFVCCEMSRCCIFLSTCVILCQAFVRTWTN